MLFFVTVFYFNFIGLQIYEYTCFFFKWCWCFLDSNSIVFCSCCSFRQKKVVHFWKFYFDSFSFTGLISHQWLDLYLACSVHRVFTVHYLGNVVTLNLFKETYLQKYNICVKWPRNHCGSLTHLMNESANCNGVCRAAPGFGRVFLIADGGQD